MLVPRLIAAGIAVAAFVLGLIVWASGGGAAILVATAVVTGIVLCAGRLGYPAATAVVVIWSLAVWTVAGEAASVGPSSATIWNWVFLVAACLPVVVGLAVRLAFVDGATQLARDLRLRPELIAAALAGTAAMVVAVGVAWKRFGLDGMAWAMSGDARNTIQSAAEMFPEIIGGRGIVIDPTMTLYSTLAIIGSRPESGFASGAALLDHSIITLATFELGAIALMTIASAGLLVQVAGARQLPVVAVIAASLAPLLGIGIGVGLQDGFVSAFLAIAIITLSMILAALALGRDCRPGIRLLAAATIAVAVFLLLFTWAYAIAAVVPLLALVLLWSWRTWSRRVRLMVLSAIVVVAAGLGSFLPRWIEHTIGNRVFSMSGTIVAPTTWLLLLIPLIFGLLALLYGSRDMRRFFLAATIAGIAVAVTVAVICYSPEGPPGYPYYAAKLTWIWSASVIGLVFVPVALVVRGARRAQEIEAPARRSRNQSDVAVTAAGAILMTLIMLIGVRFASPLESPVLVIQPMPVALSSPIAKGWSNPAAGAVAIARQAATIDNAVVFGVTDPGNDRLANFWLDLIPSNRGGDFKGWAYYTTGDITSLCDLLSRDPQRTVVTRDAELEQQIRLTCQIPDPRVALQR
jgi:hypothetical protein